MSSRINASGLISRRYSALPFTKSMSTPDHMPHRDGTVAHGCIYCNNNSFRPSQCRPETSLKDQIRQGISYLSTRYKVGKFLVYFQPFTIHMRQQPNWSGFTARLLLSRRLLGLPSVHARLYRRGKDRPLEALAKDHFILIEYGLQSIYDKSLDYI